MTCLCMETDSSCHPALSLLLKPKKATWLTMAPLRFVDQIDRARPGLVAVFLRDADIDRQVGAGAWAAHDARFASMRDCSVPAGGRCEPAREAAGLERRDRPRSSAARSQRAETILVSISSVPVRSRSSQRSKPAIFPVVTDCQDTTFCSRDMRNRLVGIEEIDRRETLDPVAFKHGFADTATSRPRPRYSAPLHITRTRRPRSPRRIGPRRMHDLRAVKNVDPVERRRADHVDIQPHRRHRRSRRSRPSCTSRLCRGVAAPSAGSSS